MVDFGILGNRSKLALLGAVGAGCIIGASGIMLIQRLSQKVEAVPIASGNMLRRELESIRSEIRDLNYTLEELKTQRRKPKPLKSALRTVTFADVNESFEEKKTSLMSSSTSNGTDFYSAISSDSDNEEYFDLPSDIDDNGSSNILSPEEAKILSLFTKVDELLEGQTEEQKLAYVLLRENESQYAQNSEFLWRMCKSLYMMSVIAITEGDEEKRKDLVYRATEMGHRSLLLNDKNAEAHKWYAISIGTKGEYLGIREKILDGFEFKKHIDIAADLAPHDHSIQYLLGRFCYEVSELSWIERKMASTLFADPPISTMEEAFQHFYKAETLKPDGWKENRLYMAKCQMKLQRYDEALKWLHSAKEVPIVSVDDQQAQDEVCTLLEDLKQYQS